MVDLSQTIAPKSDQINADDMIAGPMTITVTKVTAGKPDQPINIHFEGSGKVFRPCKSMRRVLIEAWGDNGTTYVGKSMTLYRDAGVTWGGETVGGVRISHMSHIQSAMQMALTATRGKRPLYTVKPLKVEVQTAQERSENVVNDPAQDRAAAWAEKMIADINALGAIADLEAMTGSKRYQDGAARLRTERPELADGLDAAVQRAIADLDPFAGEAP